MEQSNDLLLLETGREGLLSDLNSVAEDHLWKDGSTADSKNVSGRSNTSVMSGYFLVDHDYGVKPWLPRSQNWCVSGFEWADEEVIPEETVEVITTTGTEPYKTRFSLEDLEIPLTPGLRPFLAQLGPLKQSSVATFGERKKRGP